MKSISLRQRTLVSLAAIALSLGGTLEIAAAASASSARNLEELTTTELASPNITTASAHDSERVAIKFKKHSGRKFKMFRGRKLRRHHGRKIKKHHGFYGHGFKLKKY